MLKLLHGLLAALALLAPLPAMAQMPSAEFEARLAKYDPIAVKAAQNYFRNAYGMRNALANSVRRLQYSTGKMVKEKNPGIDNATVREFVEVVAQVMYADNEEFFEKAQMVAMLDTFTTEEIVAIDKFYTSDAGRAVVVKAPQMAARLPAMFEILQSEFLPVALERAQKALKMKGKDIRI